MAATSRRASRSSRIRTRSTPRRSTSCSKVYAQQKQQQDAQERDEPAPDAIFAVDIAPDLKLGQVEGPANAPVTIVKAFDFACPYCRQVSDTLEDLVKTYNGKVRVVFKNMVVHPQVATTAHLASCAAAKQGKYPQFKNALWDKGFDAYAAARDPSKLGEDNIVAIAKDVGLDMAKFKTDMKSDECKQHLQTDMQELAEVQGQLDPDALHQRHARRRRAARGELQADDRRAAQDRRASGVPAPTTTRRRSSGKGEKQFRSKKDPKPS